MNPFKVIFALAGMFVLAYFIYVSWQARNVPNTIEIGSAASFKSIPATKCSIRNNNGTISGTLYVFHDAARFDITSVVDSKPMGVHVTVSREDTAYYWIDGEKTGSRGDYGLVYNSVGLGAITRVDCNPWWFPNGTLFIVPQDITFSR